MGKCADVLYNTCITKEGNDIHCNRSTFSISHSECIFLFSDIREYVVTHIDNIDHNTLITNRNESEKRKADR